ncbi:hypothetical protein CkaCkLH20_04144 [Colletotrichum karsti]|uniref:Uncharacterized protein n=1 Tax=Colletotrichum karsti TaxID=1095194 RepID=A0A9P6ICN5_9PEZI|nr:uncharacterized protein CkaCkLH20_04144 [Colletotrichum karsti]KAF9878106.1 hypothetical protein CkaCkLH20_04144 [Colletotrichum karsti]
MGLSLTPDLLRHANLALGCPSMSSDFSGTNRNTNDGPARTHKHNHHSSKSKAQSFGNLHKLQLNLGQIIRAAEHMVNNPFCWTHKQCIFSLHHPQALDLAHNALFSAGIESDTLYIEYSPDRGEMVLKTSESPIHSDFGVRFDRLLRDAVKSNNNVPYIVNKPGTVITVSEEAPSGGAGAIGQLRPDGGWSIHNDDAHGRLVLEVAYSQPQKDVARKCEEYIYGSRGLMRAAIAVKIFYPRSTPDKYTDILNHLDECFIGL